MCDREKGGKREKVGLRMSHKLSSSFANLLRQGFSAQEATADMLVAAESSFGSIQSIPSTKPATHL